MFGLLPDTAQPGQYPNRTAVGRRARLTRSNYLTGGAEGRAPQFTAPGLPADTTLQVNERNLPASLRELLYQTVRTLFDARNYEAIRQREDEDYADSWRPVRSFAAGRHGLRSSIDNAVAAGNRFIGRDEAAQDWERSADEAAAKAEGARGKVPTLREAKGLGDYGQIASDWIFSNAPLMAATIPAGGIGSLAGKAALGGLAGRVLGPEAAAIAGGAMADVGATAGATAGAAVPYYATTAGDTYGRLRNDPAATGTDREKAGAALLSGAAQTALGVGPLGHLAHNLSKGAGPLRSILTTAGEEAITEGGEQFIQRATHHMFNPQVNLFDPQARQEYLEAALGGAVVGGGYAGAGHGVSALLGRLTRPAQRATPDAGAPDVGQPADIAASDEFGSGAAGDAKRMRFIASIDELIRSGKYNPRDTQRLVDELNRRRAFMETEEGIGFANELMDRHIQPPSLDELLQAQAREQARGEPLGTHTVRDPETGEPVEVSGDVGPGGELQPTELRSSEYLNNPTTKRPYISDLGGIGDKALNELRTADPESDYEKTNMLDALHEQWLTSEHQPGTTFEDFANEHARKLLGQGNYAKQWKADGGNASKFLSRFEQVRRTPKSIEAMSDGDAALNLTARDISNSKEPLVRWTSKPKFSGEGEGKKQNREIRIETERGPAHVDAVNLGHAFFKRLQGKGVFDDNAPKIVRAALSFLTGMSSLLNNGLVGVTGISNIDPETEVYRPNDGPPLKWGELLTLAKQYPRMQQLLTNLHELQVIDEETQQLLPAGMFGKQREQMGARAENARILEQELAQQSGEQTTNDLKREVAAAKAELEGLPPNAPSEMRREAKDRLRAAEAALDRALNSTYADPRNDIEQVAGTEGQYGQPLPMAPRPTPILGGEAHPGEHEQRDPGPELRYQRGDKPYGDNRFGDTRNLTPEPEVIQETLRERARQERADAKAEEQTLAELRAAMEADTSRRIKNDPRWEGLADMQRKQALDPQACRRWLMLLASCLAWRTCRASLPLTKRRGTSRTGSTSRGRRRCSTAAAAGFTSGRRTRSSSRRISVRPPLSRSWRTSSATTSSNSVGLGWRQRLRRRSTKNSKPGRVLMGEDTTVREALLEKFGLWWSDRSDKGAGFKVDRAIGELSEEERNYLFNFEEWFADQVSRWAETSAKPQTVVEQFFADVAAKLRQLLEHFQSRGFKVADSVRELLDGMVEANRIDAESETGQTPQHVVLPPRNKYTAKDQTKSDRANKFIGRGSANSSTEAYRQAWGDQANTGEYASSDTVFVSVEGSRRGRVSFDENEVLRAIQAGVTFITDNREDRNRPYNTGERELAEFLRRNGYEESAPGTWTPAAVQSKAQTGQQTGQQQGSSPTPTTPQGGQNTGQGAPPPPPQGPPRPQHTLADIANAITSWDITSGAALPASIVKAIRQTLKDSLKPAEWRALLRAAEGPEMQRRMQEALGTNAAAIADIESDPELAAAYLYAMLRNGSVSAGPQTTQTAAQVHRVVQGERGRFRAWVEEQIFGEHTEARQLDDLLAELAQNSPLTTSPDVRASYLEAPAAIRDRAHAQQARLWRERVNKWRAATYERVMYTPYERLMETGNAYLERIVRLLHRPPWDSEGRGESYIEGKMRRFSEFGARYVEVLGARAKDAAFKAQVAAAMNNPDVLAAASPEVKAMVEALRAKIFDPAYDYAQEADLTFDKRENYTPWRWNKQKLADNMAEFVRFSSDPRFEKDWKNIQETWERRWGVYDTNGNTTTLTLPEFIERRMSEVFYGDGVQEETTREGGHNPGATFINPRELNFLQRGDAASRAKLAEFFDSNLDHIMLGYINSLAKRAEFARRFGRRGEKLRDMLEMAKKLGASDSELRLAEDAVNAATGMHGIRTRTKLEKLAMNAPLPGFIKKHFVGQHNGVINNRLQNAMGWAITYQNYRLLALSAFSSFIDPLGVGVRAASPGVMMRALWETVGGDRAALKEMARILGTTDQNQIFQDLAAEFYGHHMSATQKKLNDALFTLNGVEHISRFSRLMATSGAVLFLKKHVQSPERAFGALPARAWAQVWRRRARQRRGQGAHRRGARRGYPRGTGAR